MIKPAELKSSAIPKPIPESTSKPDQRVEVKLAPKKVDIVVDTEEGKVEEKENKESPRKRFSPKGFRSMNAIDEVIKEVTEKNAEGEELLGGEDMPNTPFGQDKLDELWKTYVQTHIDKSNRSLFTTLNSRTPDLKPEFQLYFPIENHVQLNQIDQIKVDLVNFLRKHLNNYSLSLITPVKKLESKKHIYTDEEKYKTLAEKYPLLEELRKGLDLDLNH